MERPVSNARKTGNLILLIFTVVCLAFTVFVACGDNESSSGSWADRDFKTADVLNGSGDKVIGQRAYIELSSEELEAITPEQLLEFAKARVDGSDYNWVSLIGSDGKGVVFTGSMIEIVKVGSLDGEGRVSETLGRYELKDGSYIYTAE